MNRLQVAVIGGGHLGTIHAHLWQQLPNAELVAIAEPNPTRAAQLADEFPCPIVTDFVRLLSNDVLDAAVLAAPTSLHHDIGMLLLKRGIHTLIEKPLAPSASECERLVAAAEQSNCVLQVGHVERFNPAWTALTAEVGEPRLIEAVREGPLSFRSMDIGVVLDLMIHDIDLVLSLVDSPVIAVQASGFAWTGPNEDIAQARITFANGCLAQISCSRVSCEPTRQMRIYGGDFYASVDFGSRTGYIVRGPTQRDWQTRSISPEERQRLMERLFQDVLPRQVLEVADDVNPILEELLDFVTSIRTGATPRVSGRAGMAAVDVANQVIRRIEGQQMALSYIAPARKAG